MGKNQKVPIKDFIPTRYWGDKWGGRVTSYLNRTLRTLNRVQMKRMHPRHATVICERISTYFELCSHTTYLSWVYLLHSILYSNQRWCSPIESLLSLELYLPSKHNCGSVVSNWNHSQHPGCPNRDCCTAQSSPQLLKPKKRMNFSSGSRIMIGSWWCNMCCGWYLMMVWYIQNNVFRCLNIT